MTYRRQRDALFAQQAALARELADVRAEIRDLDARSVVPSLGAVRLATPCGARWKDMPGDERVRVCGRCDKHVYNLVAMTGEQAEALVRAVEGDGCAPTHRRADGTMLTSDCEIASMSPRRTRVLTRIAAGVTGVLVAAAVAAGVLVHVRAVAARERASREAAATSTSASGPQGCLLGAMRQPARPFLVHDEPRWTGAMDNGDPHRADLRLPFHDEPR